MIDLSALWLFVPASLLLIVAPGPDILFLVTQGTTNGSRAGFLTALGLAAGNLVHTLGAALGVSMLFQTSELAFQALKFAGVAYLLFLAYKALGAGSSVTSATDDRPVEHALFWRGFLMNVLNPKVALFFVAFLPQFASPAAGPLWMQMAFLGVLFTAMVVVVFGTIGTWSGRLARSWPWGREGLARNARWMVAAVYGCLALRLAFVVD